MVDAARFFAKLRRDMTKKTRNWLLALCILAFPFVLFLGCLVFMEEPPKSHPNEPVKALPQDPVSGTNMVHLP
jgi:hypothetical protein